MKDMKKNLSEKDQYTKEDLDEVLDCLVGAIEIMNNKPLMKLLKAHADKRGKQIEALQELSDTKVKSIDDLRKKKYEAFKED